jgi:L-rhamnose mutarotase
MTAKEIAEEIRKNLKKHGITSRQVSVRAKTYLLDKLIEVRIKDLKVSKKLVEAIAKKYEYVRWDDYTNDILAGGNTYVTVDFDYKGLREKAEEFKETARKILEKKDKYDKDELMRLAEKEDLVVLYQPHHNGTYPQVKLCKRNNHSCILDNLESYYAADEYGLSEALAILSYQYGFDFTKVKLRV